MTEPLKKAAFEFLQSHPIAHLSTIEDNAPWCRVMHTCRIDDDFTLWYSSAASSNKIRQISKCGKVCITVFGDEKDLRVLGDAEVVRDPKLKREMWREQWLEYFPKGAEDPEYVLVRVKPRQVEYRDLKEQGFVPQRVV